MEQRGNGPGPLYYERYLALERGGWLEYGFYPLSPVETEPKAYYAKIVANIVGFLGFLKDAAAHRSIDPSGISIGMALRGIKDTSLVCITDRMLRWHAESLPQERDTMLVLRPAEDGPWDVNSVAGEFAENILGHWEFSRPTHWADTPEFEAAVYKGKFFRANFQQW